MDDALQPLLRVCLQLNQLCRELRMSLRSPTLLTLLKILYTGQQLKGRPLNKNQLFLNLTCFCPYTVQRQLSLHFVLVGG